MLAYCTFTMRAQQLHQAAAALHGNDSKALGRVCVDHFYRVAGARLKICYLNSTKCVSSLSHTFSSLERTNVNPKTQKPVQRGVCRNLQIMLVYIQLEPSLLLL